MWNAWIKNVSSFCQLKNERSYWHIKSPLLVIITCLHAYHFVGFDSIAMTFSQVMQHLFKRVGKVSDLTSGVWMGVIFIWLQATFLTKLFIIQKFELRLFSKSEIYPTVPLTKCSRQIRRNRISEKLWKSKYNLGSILKVSATTLLSKNKGRTLNSGEPFF